MPKTHRPNLRTQCLDLTDHFAETLPFNRPTQRELFIDLCLGRTFVGDFFCFYSFFLMGWFSFFGSFLPD